MIRDEIKALCESYGFGLHPEDSAYLEYISGRLCYLENRTRMRTVYYAVVSKTFEVPMVAFLHSHPIEHSTLRVRLDDHRPEEILRVIEHLIQMAKLTSHVHQ